MLKRQVWHKGQEFARQAWVKNCQGHGAGEQGAVGGSTEGPTEGVRQA